MMIPRRNFRIIAWLRLGLPFFFANFEEDER